jgi:hypothetical protein
MKKTGILLLIILFFLNSCGYKETIVYQNDEYRKTQNAYVKIYESTDEKITDILSGRFTFALEKKQQKETYKIYTTIHRSSGSFALLDTFYMILDNKIYEKYIEKRDIKLRHKTVENTENMQINDSTTINVVTGISSETWKEEQFLIELNKQQIHEILNSDTISFRFYSGPSFGTIHLIERNLYLIKELFSQVK